MLALFLACQQSPVVATAADPCPAFSGLDQAGTWRRWESDDGSWMETLVSARHTNRKGWDDLLVDTVFETDDTRFDIHVIARCDDLGMHHLGAEVATSDHDASLNSVALGDLVLPHDLQIGDTLPDGGVIAGEADVTVGDNAYETLEIHYGPTETMCANSITWLHAELGMVRSESDGDCDGTPEVTELVATGT